MADRKISELAELTLLAEGDYFPVVDISEASADDKNKRVSVLNLAKGAQGQTSGPAFPAQPAYGSNRPFFRTDLGWWFKFDGAAWVKTSVSQRNSVAIPHNTATTLAVITLSAAGDTGCFLVSICFGTPSTAAAGNYVLQTAWSDVQIATLGTVAKFGVTTFTLTAAANVGTGKITLTLTQANSSGEMGVAGVAVTPLIQNYEGNGTFTVGAS